jgi:hypothetical protein
LAKPSLLQDPVWTDAADLCIGCGYSLRGLAAPGKCPECGAEFGTGQLVLTGIVNRSRRTSPARRAAWTAVITGAILLSLFWIVLLVFNAVLLIATVIAVGGGLIALWITGPRERSGIERLVMAPAGIARVAIRTPTDQNRLDTIYTPWGNANSVEITRVSPVWRRVKVRIVESGAGVTSTIFDAGFRCSDAAAPDVDHAIRGLIRGALAARAGTIAPPPTAAADPPSLAEPAPQESAQAPDVRREG